ncbi:MAG: MFS transporter [Gammaproteobacteria bacterium]|nr:MFS transporter [Gammaproteobacteria bacterium]
MLNRNVIILFFTQLIFVSGSIVLVTLGGIVGNELASSRSLATLPLSVMVIGTAVTTVPASLLMQRIGRRYGFALAALIACSGALIAAYALETGSFVWFCAAATTIGITLAFSQQFRFAAAESVPIRRVSYAISFILLGSIGGAFLGPEIAARSAAYDPATPFRAAMLTSAGLYLVAAGLLLCMSRVIMTVDHDSNARADARPMREVVVQPLFMVAVLAGIVGQGVMTFVMTATPLSMHVLDGHGIDEAAGVVRAHVIAMYLPSLISAPLIARFGSQRLMAAGVLAMLATLGFGLSGQAVMHYWWALVLLGLGWNFLYVGGTTLLVKTYRPSERFRAQAVNEFSVFGISALASLLAGTIIIQLGWTALLMSTLPLLIAMLLALLWARGRTIMPANDLA